MLRAHQACIDLEKGVLRIQGREVKFLAEHELPEKARQEMEPASATSASAQEAGPSSSAAQQPAFPGSGHTLGAAPQAGRGRGAPGAGANTSQSRYSEDTIQTLMGLGVSREAAIRTLDAAGGNLDVAASLLF